MLIDTVYQGSQFLGKVLMVLYQITDSGKVVTVSDEHFVKADFFISKLSLKFFI